MSSKPWYFRTVHFSVHPDILAAGILPKGCESVFDVQYLAEDCDMNAPFIYKQVTEFTGKKGEYVSSEKSKHRSVLSKYVDGDDVIAHRLLDYYAEMNFACTPAPALEMRSDGLYVMLLNPNSSANRKSLRTALALDDEDNYVEAELTFSVSDKDGKRTINLLVPVSFHTSLKTEEDVKDFLYTTAWKDARTARSLLPDNYFFSVSSLSDYEMSFKGLSFDRSQWT